MKNELQISMLQLDLAWENKEINFKKTEQALSKCIDSDLILLPEMFSTGFSMKPKLWAEPDDGPTLSFLKGMAIKYKTALCTSFIVVENDLYFNRLFFIKPDGSWLHYDKKHLFTLADEHKYYTAGKQQIIVDYLGWRIMPLVCYDLRFPVWSRNTMGYDLLLYVANWPEKRSEAWCKLLPARAIENMSYVAGVNRCGMDGNGIFHSGNSAIYNPLGGIISEAKDASEQHVHALLNREELIEIREKFQFLEDKDAFKWL